MTEKQQRELASKIYLEYKIQEIKQDNVKINSLLNRLWEDDIARLTKRPVIFNEDKPKVIIAGNFYEVDHVSSGMIFTRGLLNKGNPIQLVPYNKHKILLFESVIEKLMTNGN